MIINILPLLLNLSKKHILWVLKKFKNLEQLGSVRVGWCIRSSIQTGRSVILLILVSDLGLFT